MSDFVHDFHKLCHKVGVMEFGVIFKKTGCKLEKRCAAASLILRSLR